jgi:hypothetical protein
MSGDTLSQTPEARRDPHITVWKKIKRKKKRKGEIGYSTKS